MRPSRSTERTREPVMRNPVSRRKTSTPPETVPNQMWYTATSRAATARRPSMSARRLFRGRWVMGVATTSVTRLWAGVDTDQLRARGGEETGYGEDGVRRGWCGGRKRGGLHYE